jgi:hypothetical protein
MLGSYKDLIHQVSGKKGLKQAGLSIYRFSETLLNPCKDKNLGGSVR